MSLEEGGPGWERDVVDVVCGSNRKCGEIVDIILPLPALNVSAPEN